MTAENEQLMKREIEERMASDLWSHRIASGVMKRRRRRQRIIYSASSLATAALVVFVTLFSIDSIKKPTLQYSDFITLQVQGVHKASLQKDIIMTSTSQGTSNGLVLSSDVDYMIEDAMLLR